MSADTPIEPDFCIDHGITPCCHYKHPDGNRVELQVDAFGDWAASTQWMRTSPDFRSNPIGVFGDPARVAETAASGASFADDNSLGSNPLLLWCGHIGADHCSGAGDGMDLVGVEPTHLGLKARLAPTRPGPGVPSYARRVAGSRPASTGGVTFQNASTVAGQGPRERIAAQALDAYELVSRADAADDRHAPCADAEAPGDQPAKRPVGTIVERRSAHAHPQDPVAFADDLVAVGAGRQTHRDVTSGHAPHELSRLLAARAATARDRNP